MAESPTRENLVIFRERECPETRASLLRLTWHIAAFEVFGVLPTFRMSDVLPEVRILVGGSTLYAGQGLVSNLVDTGTGFVCEIKLDPKGLNRALWAAEGQPPASLAESFAGFLRDWQKLYRVLPEYKVAVADLQSFLTDLRLWLEQAELRLNALPPAERARHEQQMAQELAPCVVPAIASLFERYEHVAQRVEADAVPAHRVFGKQQLHPLLLCAPFVLRTYAKPLGYAGDYEMVNMMFRDPFEGASLFAKMINAYALQLPPILGHRNRISLLTEMLAHEALRVARQTRSLRVFTLGCGPAQEVQRFLSCHILSDCADLTLADFNDETLNRTSATLEDLKRQHARKTRLNLVKTSAQQLIKNADKRDRQNAEMERFDLVYCAGLFDYLSDKLCKRLMEVFYGMLAPGGLLLATNVDTHPARHEMECFLDWHLVHRDTSQLRSLTPVGAAQAEVVVKRDATGVNVFLEIRKPDHAR